MKFGTWIRTGLGELTLALVALAFLACAALAVAGFDLARMALLFLLGGTAGLILVSLTYRFFRGSRAVLGLLFVFSFVLLALVPEAWLFSVQGFMIYVGGSFLRELSGRTTIGEDPSARR